MHPFWAVRRMTALQLQRERALNPKAANPPRFNCKLQDHQFQAFAMSTIEGTHIKSSYTVHVPLLRNAYHLEKDEELILQIDEKAEKKNDNRKRSWKQIWDADNKKQKKTNVTKV